MINKRMKYKIKTLAIIDFISGVSIVLLTLAIIDKQKAKIEKYM